MRRFRINRHWICVVFLIYTTPFLVSSKPVSLQSLLHFPTNIRTTFKTALSVSDFGAIGNGINDDTQAFINAWNTACSSTVRTKILFPSKRTYLVHPIFLGGPCLSNITLKISGTILAPEDPKAWLGLNPRKWLYVHEVNHLTVEGRGTINGMGQKWWSRSCKITSSNPCRHAPTAITFHKCENLKVRNLVLVNSQQMHMALTNCDSVKVSRLRLVAPASSPNTDGVHISSSTNVEVKDSVIRTGDDCISIVGNSSRIRIRRIECGPGHGISIGSLGKSNAMSQVHDVIVNEAKLSNTDNGARIKTWQGGSGFISKITFKNMSMKKVSNPIIIDQYYCDSPKPCRNQSSAVKVKEVSFINIKGSSSTEEAIRFACSESFPCEKLYLEDVNLVLGIDEITKSFCWSAFGSSSGLVYPSVCSFPVRDLIRNPGSTENSLLSE